MSPPSEPATFDHESLDGARFVDTGLRGARFVRSSLAGAVMRGVDASGVDIDDPWLIESGEPLFVNGVDVTSFVDAELDRRFPGRADRRAGDPASLRTAWTAVEQTWQSTVARVSSMPPDTADISVDGEWSFAETIRHLVMATDTWLGRAILEFDHPYHPIGKPNAEYESDGHDASVFAGGTPPYPDVLDVRAERMTMVRDFIAGATPDLLAETRRNPWAPEHAETVLSCLHTILEEEWEHHRYAVRDLDAIAQRSA